MIEGKEFRLKGSIPASRAGAIVCPHCEAGEKCFFDGISVRCDSCACTVEDAVVRTLEQIASLPDALGEHACECGHPEMRKLPDGVFHCPACGSEVVSKSVLRIPPMLTDKEKTPWPTSR